MPLFHVLAKSSEQSSAQAHEHIQFKIALNTATWADVGGNGGMGLSKHKVLASKRFLLAFHFLKEYERKL